MKRLHQEEVNEIHAHANQGRKATAIGKALGIPPATVAYVLKHRKPTKEVPCTKCEQNLTLNRTRRVKGLNKTYSLCVTCHHWLFAPANYHEARERFPGVF